MTPSPVIVGADLACELGGKLIFSQLDLHIPRGSFVGIFGPNGAGKTSLFRILLGLIPLQGGTLQILDSDLHAARTQIGYVSQSEPKEAEGRLSVAAFVGAAWRGERWGFSWRPQALNQAVRSALELINAAHLASRPLQSLSGGQRQRARIAQALVNPARILLLDEPLNNLDPRSQQQLLHSAKALAQEKGLTVLMTGHDINPLLPYMDYVVYMANGKGRMGTINDLLTTPLLSEIYGTPVTVSEQNGILCIRVGDGFSPETICHCHEPGAQP
ncbi:MAG: ATP-binding cassette domain-containing protein [Desulfobaccales bacterium]